MIRGGSLTQTRDDMDAVTQQNSREQRVRVSRRRADSQLYAAAAAATAAFDQLNQAIALIDGVCRVSFANTLAREIFRETDGLSLRGRELVGTASPDSIPLNLALKRAVNGGQGASLRLERPSQRRPLSILITPLKPAACFPAAPAALVVISDPDRGRVPPTERLMQVYGFTLAEAGVAQMLLRGNGIAAVAKRLGVSLETARTHLRRVLAKTGTHRQSDLILVLMTQVGAIV